MSYLLVHAAGIMWRFTPRVPTGASFLGSFCVNCEPQTVDEWMTDSQFGGLNRHRIVFHCTEITTRIRRYVPGDRGVNAMAIPPRLTLLMEEQALLQKQLWAPSHIFGIHPPSVLIPKEDSYQRARTLQHRLWYVTQQIRTLYNHLYDQYQAGSRIILAGESLSWADLVQGGERTRPFCPDSVLEAFAASR